MKHSIRVIILIAFMGASIFLLNQESRSAYAAYADDTLKPIGAGASGTTSVVWDASNNQYVLQFTDGTDTVQYMLSLNETNITQGLITVKAQLNANTAIYPIYWGGARYRDSGGTVMEPYQLAGSASVSYTHSLAGNVVTFTVTDTYQSVARTKTYRYKIAGKTLVIGISSSSTNGNNNYAGVNMDRSYSTANAAIKSVSYADDQPSVMVNSSYFYSVTLDSFQSNSTSVSLSSGVFDANSVRSSSVTRYDKNSAGSVNALNETYYVTLSNDILDTIYKTNKTASAYRSTLGNYVALDIWKEGSGFADDNRTYNGMVLGSRKSMVSKLFNNWKMDKVYAMDHQWQNATYDVMLPVHYPANPMSGTGAEYASFISTMKNSYGWLAGVHEDYWYMYPDAVNNKYYDATGLANLAKDASGNNLDAWPMTDFGVMTKAIRAGKMKYYFDLESPSIASNYATNASYLDVNTAWRPDTLNQITLDASAPDSKNVKDAIISNKTLFDAIHSRYSGPLAGEGASGSGRFDSSYAGYVDAVEREIAEGTTDLDSEIIVDYEIKHIRPLMANQGMGYYSRFFLSEKDATATDWDKYYAMTIAFAHTGLMTQSGSPGNVYSQYGKMYYMLQALQAQYLDTSVAATTIEYWNGTSYRSVSQAMKDGYNFKKAKIHIVYSNGLNIYVNFDDSNWTVSYNSVSYTLDKNGWVAGNSSLNFLEYSSLSSGHRVDYVDSIGYTYADARGTSTAFSTFTTQGQKLIRKSIGDAAAPVIDNVKITNTTDTTAVITWTTDENASTSLEYGLTGSYGSKVVPSLDFDKTHSIALTGLSANTVYHFRVRSEDIANNGTNSNDFVLTTQPSGNKASAQFSSTQGLNNWYYQYWNGSNYTNLPVWDGTNSMWKLDTDNYSFIGSSYQHPGASVDSVRKWVAASAGWYQISGDFYRTSSESPWASSTSGDGLNVSIKLNNDTVFSKYVESQEYIRNRHDLVLYLNVNDALYFTENRNSNNAFDGINWDPVIIPLNKNTFTASTDFTADNGKYGWYERSWDGTKYKDMAYSSSVWTEGSASIGSNWLKPSDTRDASRLWIASVSGDIRITGSVMKKVTGGDGVTASIMLNNTQAIWSANIGASDTTGLSHAAVIHVEAGDIVEFRVNRGTTSTSDDTTWDPTVSYVKPYSTVDDISSSQGANQWYYQKWDGIAYSNLTWNTNKWELASTYLAIDANNMHPESAYDAVRKWVAPNDGRVKVYGTIQRPNSGGDGVIASVLLNSTPYWNLTIAGTDTSAKSFSYYITVHAGDTIYFRLNKNANITNDTTAWKLKVEYDRQEFSAAVDFAAVQGLNGWSYQRLNAGSYYDLSWSTDHWYYSTYLSVFPTTVHPETNDDAVRKWVAPFKGTIRIKGTAKVNSSGGDGIIATIKQNTTALWTRTVSGVKLGYLPEAAFAFDVTVNVNANDIIYFNLNKNSTLSNDASTFSPVITYTQKY